MRLRIVIILSLVLFAIPLPARAQDRYCANLDFRSVGGDFNAGMPGVWVAGQGWQTQSYSGYDVIWLNTAPLAPMRIDQIQISFDVITWGGGDSPLNDKAYLGSYGQQNMIDELHASPGNYTLSWAGSEAVTGELTLELYASGSGGSGGVGYMRSMYVCGSSLPAEWLPVPYGFEADDPWPDSTPWARATPTPWATPEATLEFGLVDSDAGNVVDTAINMYHYANQQGALDTLTFIVMTVLILMLIFRVIRKLKEEA